MKKGVSLLMLGLLLAGLNLLAADGDVIVNGNVGVGITNPGDSVHVSRNSTSASFGGLPGFLASNLSTGSNSFAAVRTNAGNGVVSGGFFTDGLGSGSTMGRQGVFIGSFSTHPVAFGIAGVEKMTMDTSGYVGIGTTTPGSYMLNVAGPTYCQLGYWSGSDARWKKNVQPIGNALSLIDGLQGVRFDWNADALRARLAAKTSNGDMTSLAGASSLVDKKIPGIDDKQIGLIAQDVEKVFPELVQTDADGYKAVSYEKLTAVLIQAVKELKAEVDKLKAP